jgi:hypothetical protein
MQQQCRRAATRSSSAGIKAQHPTLRGCSRILRKEFLGMPPPPSVRGAARARSGSTTRICSAALREAL